MRRLRCRCPSSCWLASGKTETSWSPLCGSRLPGWCLSVAGRIGDCAQTRSLTRSLHVHQFHFRNRGVPHGTAKRSDAHNTLSRQSHRLCWVHFYSWSRVHAPVVERATSPRSYTFHHQFFSRLRWSSNSLSFPSPARMPLYSKRCLATSKPWSILGQGKKKHLDHLASSS